MAIAIARRRWRMKLSERVSRRRNNCADDGIGRREARPQGKARATTWKQQSMSGFTQLEYAFLHSPSLSLVFTRRLPSECIPGADWLALGNFTLGGLQSLHLVNRKSSVLSQAVGKQLERAPDVKAAASMLRKETEAGVQTWKCVSLLQDSDDGSNRIRSRCDLLFRQLIYQGM